MGKTSENLKTVHRRVLIWEALNGKIRRDTLPNSAFAFSGELIANYSARTRIFMDSGLAHMIMYHHADRLGDADKLLSRG